MTEWFDVDEAEKDMSVSLIFGMLRNNQDGEDAFTKIYSHEYHKSGFDGAESFYECRGDDSGLYPIEGLTFRKLFNSVQEAEQAGKMIRLEEPAPASSRLVE
jgi:hypothetical protein